VLMGEIYRRARRVTAWLGPDEDDSSFALEFLDNIGGLVLVNWDTYTMMPTPSAIAQGEGHWADMSSHIPFSKMPREFTALKALLDRPWFERVWIRQEICLRSSQSVVKCGSKAVTWLNFQRAIRCLCLKGTDSPVDKASFIRRVAMVTAINAGRCQVRRS
jgi:hypothetical protein